MSKKFKINPWFEIDFKLNSDNITIAIGLIISNNNISNNIKIVALAVTQSRRILDTKFRFQTERQIFKRNIGKLF